VDGEPQATPERTQEVTFRPEPVKKRKKRKPDTWDV
jgi:hypothetical protein